MNNLTKLSTILAVLIAISGCVAIVADDSVAEGDPSIVDGEDGGSSTNDPTGDGFYFEVNGKQYQTLNAAVKAVSKAGEIKVLEDFDMNKSDIVEIPKDKIITLDMNGKKATASSDFSGRYITNYGTLTITGDGTFEDAESADYRGPVTNNGTLTIENGTFYGNTKNTYAHIWNSKGATATFNGGTYEGAVTMINGYIGSTTYINGGTYINSLYPTIDNSGHMEIRGGEFVNKSCSACNESKYQIEKPWGYTIRSGFHSSDSYLLIDETEGRTIEVTGVQGALSVIGGKADIKSGSFETLPCETHGASSSYYALFVAPEKSEPSVTVSGGDFKTAYRAAARIGMDNGSSDLQSNVRIEGGRFTAPAGVDSISVNAVGGGDATISGGNFSSDVSEYCVPGFEPVRDANGNYVVGSDEPDQPATVPDDDELPPFIPAQPDDDDSVTIVACAAAAVVAALMAVFLILTYRKD